jgi:hypothetical protein
LQKNNINFKLFYESDRDNELTSIATEPISGEKRSIFKKFNCLKGEKNDI